MLTLANLTPTHTPRLALSRRPPIRPHPAPHAHGASPRARLLQVLARDEIWGVRKASVESLAVAAAMLSPCARPTRRPLRRLPRRRLALGAHRRVPGARPLHRDAAVRAHLRRPAHALRPARVAEQHGGRRLGHRLLLRVQLPRGGAGGGRRPLVELADARTLTTNLQWKVRRTLSFSLHALAAVLGRDAAEAELVGTFDHFLKDLDEVKVGVIAHIAAFLAVLSEGERRKYLPTLLEIKAETDNWRFRHTLAVQLTDLGAIFDHDAVVGTLVPLALDLCCDPVAEVRVAAIGQVGPLLGACSTRRAEATRRRETLTAARRTPPAGPNTTICEMAGMTSCFAILCAHLCVADPRAPRRRRRHSLLPILAPLADDRVGVRLPSRASRRASCSRPPSSPCPPSRRSSRG